MVTATLTLRIDDPTAPYVADLLTHHLSELASVMGEHAFALDSSGLSAPEVTFWTAWRGDLLAGFAALKDLGDGEGEVKSMRAAPEARGTGVGRALLDHVVSEARARGYARLYLETGTAELHQPAIALYRKGGFTSCPPFADYAESPHNQFMVLDFISA
ncbi:putative acetyltransferase [Novosphingobium sp. PhB165]|uniref:GNAT family N-acetyltransferase n=1 Tax=Novosphingobium sp. PhB165 TaxID=2485105 RepID=UPI0010D85B12|nr:GNAT family N-acetyltransferase [Novosphingobium sp. PhB165]TCM22250.1 putative acetyltransferase [Novosphingobium sp. PhB165]